MYSDNGLTKFEGGQGLFYKATQGLKDDFVVELLEDAEGRFWAINRTGITSFDPYDKQSSFTHYSLPVDWNESIHLVMDDQGKIWLPVENNLCRFSKDSIEFFSSPLLEKDPLRYLKIGPDGTIWGSHFFNGISKFDGEHMTYYTEKDGLRSEFARVELVDEQNNVWISTRGYGLQRFAQNFIQHLNFEGIFRGGAVSAIAEDHAGNLWFGSHSLGGIAKFDGTSYVLFDSLHKTWPGHIFRSIYEDREQNLWMGSSDSSLFKWNGKDLLRYSQAQGLVNDNIYAITQDLEGNMWFGGANMWTGAKSGGLTKYDGTSFIQYELQPSGGVADVNNIRALMTDRKGNVWIGSYGGGLIKYDGEHFTFYTTKEGLSSNLIVSLLEDQDGNIWAGTPDAGVNRFDGQHFRNFSSVDGLSGNDVWTIVEDLSGNIWLGIGDCLNLIIKERNSPEANQQLANYRAIDYCNIDGVRGGEFFTNTSIRDNKGRIWWGSEKWVSMLPLGLYPTQKILVVELSDIEIGQIAVDYRQLAKQEGKGKDAKVPKADKLNFADIEFDEIVPFQNYPKGLKLPHLLNHLTFRFSITNYPKPDFVQFSYFMEGIDNHWSNPSSENKAEYRGLPPVIISSR